ncbi:MAG: hypothetical protein HY736_27865, partial [Verrucomicrobia bacterium]|nr:hypothetical protein [Verrucomicrobiota bacterium]
HGGVLVHQMPDTLFLQDTDGDGRADLREVIMAGWGRSDTHAGPNNLQYGLDNWIWGMLGYSGFTGSVGGKAFSFRQGFYRFRPDGSQLEFLRATNNNTWGLGLTEQGLAFASTANNNPSVYLPIPDRYYPPAGLEKKTLGTIADTSRFVPLTGRVRQVDVHWGYTSAAGHAFYTARAYPRKYWNRIAFVADPTGHLVGQFNVEAAGANFRSANPTNLIVSDDEWCAPIMAEVGPDGAVWVIDWYNYIVQHNPTPKGFEKGAGNAYDNELRDKRFGRIYRIVWQGGDGARPAAPFSLAQATPAQLVAALAHDNLLWRRHAQRLLVERGRKDVVPALITLLRDQGVDEIGLNVGAIHALWTLHGLHAIDADAGALAAATDALRHPSAGVRRNAAMILPRSTASGTAILKANLVEDSDGQVRLATLLALSETPEFPNSGAALRAALAKPAVITDRWALDAAKMAATAHQASFLAGIAPAQIAAAQQAEATALRNQLADGAIQNAFNAVIVHVARRASVGAAKISEPAEVPVSDNVGNRVVLHLGVIPDVMKFDRAELTVKAGVAAKLVFKNTDNMQHNVLVLRPGTLEAVGALADQMLADPQALAKNYVPPSSDVLFSTPLVNPNESFELNFTAPTQPGRYPIMCTFPGHWRIMQATLVVQ